MTAKILQHLHCKVEHSCRWWMRLEDHLQLNEYVISPEEKQLMLATQERLAFIMTRPRARKGK